MAENEFFDLSNLADGDVLSFPGEHTIKVSKFQNELYLIFYHYISAAFLNGLKAQGIEILNSGSSYLWFSTGQECEVLKPGGTGWQKGKVRLKVVLEFSSTFSSTLSGQNSKTTFSLT
ncbi:MAG: hypothetical protein F6K32_17975, partial [Desertifilum sp. SIO1I2]|nr:hypothetical protein [Desertifilum sp. SIO1I2]